jgi:hypothetical protein
MKVAIKIFLLQRISPFHYCRRSRSDGKPIIYAYAVPGFGLTRETRN